MKFRKKPVVIEAVQLKEDNCEEVKAFINDGSLEIIRTEMHNLDLTSVIYESDYLINTLEGQMRISLGDWVIKGVNGEFYPCKPDIFEKTYDPTVEADDYLPMFAKGEFK